MVSGARDLFPDSFRLRSERDQELRWMNADMLNKGKSPKAGPLAGLCVLDLTSVIMGPYCTQILADMGAEVIKVESPEGDVVRYAGPSRLPKMGPTFTYLNRGKKSVVVDLKTAEGREVCLRLAKRADIFIHSMRPQALKKLGLDYDDVSAAQPLIIYCNLHGFGRRGRYAGRAVYDDTIQAISGLAMLEAELLGEPQYVPSAIADKICGLSATYAVLAALWHRERTGIGQEIDVPMFETMVSFLMVEHLTGSLYDPPLGRPVYSRLIAKSRRPYRTADGYLSVLVYNDKQWRRFARAINREELLEDPRFLNVTSRTENIDAFYTLIMDILTQRTSDEWVTLLEKEEIPSARLNRTDDLFADPHLGDVQFFNKVADPISGNLTMPRFPLDFFATPVAMPQGGPRLGQDTAGVLRASGFSDAELRHLLDRKIVVDSNDQRD